MIKEQDKQKIVALLTALFPEAKIILFGSYARGDARRDSDIDIAIDAGKRLETARLGEALEILAAASVPYLFDLVDFHAIPKAMQDAISEEGVVWKT